MLFDPTMQLTLWRTWTDASLAMAKTFTSLATANLEAASKLMPVPASSERHEDTAVWPSAGSFSGQGSVAAHAKIVDLKPQRPAARAYSAAPQAGAPPFAIPGMEAFQSFWSAFMPGAATASMPPMMGLPGMEAWTKMAFGPAMAMAASMQRQAQSAMLETMLGSFLPKWASTLSAGPANPMAQMFPWMSLMMPQGMPMANPMTAMMNPMTSMMNPMAMMNLFAAMTQAAMALNPFAAMMQSATPAFRNARTG